MPQQFSCFEDIKEIDYGIGNFIYYCRVLSCGYMLVLNCFFTRKDFCFKG